MTLNRRIYFATIFFLGLTGASLFLGFLAAASVEAEEITAPSKAAIQMGLPQGTLNLLALSPVVVDGRNIGTLALYDDSSTPRPEDYLELYDSDGELVAVSWFDRFGIQRVAVDRALIEGKQKLQGDFVPVVDGEPI